MKVTKNIVVLVVLMLALIVVAGSIAEAQKFRIMENVFTNKQLINNGKDSVVSLPIEYNGTSFPALRGACPDSIRIEHFCSGDSVYAIDLYLKIKYAENASYGRVQLDSIKSTTAVVTIGGIKLTSTDYAGANTLGIVAIARATGNAAITATASKFTLRLTRYFTK
jgi:hypothetical protein